MKLPKKFLEEYPELKDMIWLFFYVRDDSKNPIGIVLITTKGRVGWSLLNTNSKDRWNIAYGFRLALHKAFYKEVEEATFIQIENHIRTRVASTKNQSTVMRFIKLADTLENLKGFILNPSRSEQQTTKIE